jgi:ATP-dependent exoDNAse (exonuclease V) alpha subunit
MCADVCVHDKNDGNPHAHVMLTMRPFEIDGSWGAKSKKEYILDRNGERIRLKSGEFKTRKICTVDWNEQTKAEEWRAGWADVVNAALECQGIDERIDHRSYERQGIDKVPTIHMGVAASQMERKGIVTERGNMNRVIAIINQKLRQSWEKIIHLKDWLKEAVAPAIHGNNEKSSIMAQLDKYKKEIKETKNPEPSALAEMYARLDRARENVKYCDKRLKNASGVDEWDKLIVDRRKAYQEYSAIKMEVKRAEASLPQRKPRSREMER